MLDVGHDGWVGGVEAVPPAVAGFSPQTILRHGVRAFLTADNRTALFCSAPKSGASAWGTVFMKSHLDAGRTITASDALPCRTGFDSIPARSRVKLAERNMTFEDLLDLNVHCLSTPAPSAEQLKAALASPLTPRVMMVRNPFARLVSGFRDKVVTNGPRLKGVPHMPDTPEAFKMFATTVFRGQQRNKHFTRQSDACGVSHGLRYQHYLRVEEINEWYAEFIQLFNLGTAVSTGWAKPPGRHEGATAHLRLDVNRSCFYVPPERSCEESLHSAHKEYDYIQESANIMQSNKMLSFYFKPGNLTTAATKFFLPDLTTFGYSAPPF
jgi:hypothetical protein